MTTNFFMHQCFVSLRRRELQLVPVSRDTLYNNADVAGSDVRWQNPDILIMAPYFSHRMLAKKWRIWKIYETNTLLFYPVEF